MKEEMIQFCDELKKLLNEGKSLKQISQWSFAERESGRNIPYMSISCKSEDGTITRIVASPISKQTSLKHFFNIPAGNGSTLDKYNLFIDLEEGGVQFTERLGRGKEMVISLI